MPHNHGRALLTPELRGPVAGIPQMVEKAIALHYRFAFDTASRSEEHTSELQSQSNLVCRLLLEKKEYLQRYDPKTQTVEKLNVQLPAVPGREPWASIDAAVVYPRQQREMGDYTCVVGGTSDRHL